MAQGQLAQAQLAQAQMGQSLKSGCLIQEVRISKAALSYTYEDTTLLH
jgi:hypothetical protein